MPTVPARVWDDAGVRAALADWDFGRVSRLIRQLVPLRQEDVAALTGLSQSYLSMLECGERRLTDIARVVQFLTGLGTPAELVRLPLPVPQAPGARGGSGAAPATVSSGGASSSAGSGAVAVGTVSATAADPAAEGSTTDQDCALDGERPWTADRMLAALGNALRRGAQEERPGARGATGAPVSGVALTAFVHHWGAEEAEPLARAAGGARVSAELCHHLQGTTDELRVMDAGSGSGAVADLARAHLTLVARVLENSTYDAETGRQLAAVAADTAAQTGWFAFDAGRHEAAQRYLLAGLRAARASGDERLGAEALSYLAIHGYSNGHPRDAVVAAQAARQKVKGLQAPALEAMLLTRQARGHARLGEREATLRALGEAGELCGAGRGAGDPHWLYWMNDGEIHGQTASASVDLGDTAQALKSFDRAVGAINEGEHRTRGLLLSRAARAHVRAGDLEAACESGAQAVGLGERVQSARLRDHLRDLARALEPAARAARTRTHSEVRALTERIAAVTAP
ncbi:helix-turn-helix domain-containing protein [Antribacter gilvus]|uniref:helix-turn-helix domain-containing protein n=1 Tax=Antribacter gilvus TaxID=2304675 RepID=UPI000F7AB958|nr:helix-turn-helix transcriptional regulator [Antribacter gilvus]